jgi:hypothetical protein
LRCAPAGEGVSGYLRCVSGPAAPPAAGNPPTAGPSTSPASCTTTVTSPQSLGQSLAAAQPGARLCLRGDFSATRLQVNHGGTATAPITLLGGGSTVVKGITIATDNVVVDGFRVLNAAAPGIEVTGNGDTVSNNVVNHPTGDDFDGLRFFGNGIKILHNDVGPTTNTNGAHADCMQTFTSGRPSSENVTIDGNRCHDISNQCLMAEGPGDVGDGGGGDGTSAHWTISNNYCQFGAGQGLMIEAVQNVLIAHNDFVGHSDKAIGLDIGATGAEVVGNRAAGGITSLVGLSSDSRRGYQGPHPQDGA